MSAMTGERSAIEVGNSISEIFRTKRALPATRVAAEEGGTLSVLLIEQNDEKPFVRPLEISPSLSQSVGSVVGLTGKKTREESFNERKYFSGKLVHGL